MAPDSIDDEARTRSDEAVRRLREESRRRIERQHGWRTFSSLCALASLAGGISLAALNAREARLARIGEEAAAEAAVAADAAKAAEAAKAERERAEATALMKLRESEPINRCLGTRGLRELERQAARDRLGAGPARRGKRAGKHVGPHEGRTLDEQLLLSTGARRGS